jgi:RNA polymerase sigma factor (sigma-70 family)
MVPTREDTEMKDGQMLEAFVKRRDEAAFESLLKLHGPMVLGVCKRVLGDHHDAEEAFQATFLVLSRKAASIVPRNRVGNWLYGVAYRTALKAKGLRDQRRTREVQDANAPEPAAQQSIQWTDIAPVLDRELNSLPEKYRVAVVLCDLEGRSHRDVAQELGCPEGTLSGRLMRARNLLAQRLGRQGFAMTVGALTALITQNAASAAVPVSLMLPVVQTASQQSAAQEGISPKVAQIVDAVVKSLFFMTIKHAAVQATVGLIFIAGFSAVVLANYAYFVGPLEFEKVHATVLPESLKFSVPAGFHGTLIASVVNNAEQWDSGLFKLQLDGQARVVISYQQGDCQRLKRSKDYAYFPLNARIDPAGKSVALSADRQFHLIDPNGHWTQLADVWGVPVWSPDGEWIVCSHSGELSNGWGGNQPNKGTWKYAKDGSSKTRLPLSLGKVVWDWSPDGRWFLTSELKGSTNELRKVFSLLDTSDYTTSIPLEFGEPVSNPRFSRDGSAIFHRTGPTIIRRDLISNEQSVSLGNDRTMIYDGGSDLAIEDFACSADGKFLALATYDINTLVPGQQVQGKLLLVTIADGTSQELQIANSRAVYSVDLR